MEIIKNTANVFATGFRAVLTTYAWNSTVQRVSHEFGTPFDRGRKESEKKDEDKRRGKERRRRKGTLVTKRTRPGALCEARKKAETIYKASRHRNWASLRQTLEEDTGQDVSLRGT